MKLEIKPYQKLFIDCRHSALIPIVNYYGKDIFALIADIDFFFCRKKIIEEYDIEMRFSRGRSRKIALQDMGINQIDYEYSNNLVCFCQEMLNQGYPVIIRTDMYYQQSMLKYYCKEHKSHYLLIIGYTDEDFIIIDTVTGVGTKCNERLLHYDEAVLGYEGFIKYYIDTGLIHKPSLSVYKGVECKNQKSCENKYEQIAFELMFSNLQNKIKGLHMVKNYFVCVYESIKKNNQFLYEKKERIIENLNNIILITKYEIYKFEELKIDVTFIASVKSLSNQYILLRTKIVKYALLMKENLKSLENILLILRNVYELEEKLSKEYQLILLQYCKDNKEGD